jgi:hypothetical protein
MMVGLLLMLPGNDAAGQAGAEDPPAAKAVNPTQPELPPFTSEREAAAQRFLAEHHPELGQVLDQLKTLSREQYEQAIRELSQAIQRMTLVRTKDQQLYELQLSAWKVNSQIEVLAAWLASSSQPDAELEAELKSLLYRQVDLQRQQVEHNRRRTLATLQSMEASIQWLQENRDQLAERRFQNLIQVRHKMATKRKQQSAGAPTPDRALPRNP